MLLVVVDGLGDDGGIRAMNAELGLEAYAPRRDGRGGQEVSPLGVGCKEAGVPDEVSVGRRDEGRQPTQKGQRLETEQRDTF